MSKLTEYLLEKREKDEAFLIEDDGRVSKTKDDYIVDADEGLIVAFRINFKSKSKIPLTKVISGKILENNKEEEIYMVETRNGLKYGVPYSSVVWVKTGSRWPRGVYEEMKKGSVVITDSNDEGIELGELDQPPVDVD